MEDGKSDADVARTPSGSSEIAASPSGDRNPSPSPKARESIGIGRTVHLPRAIVEQAIVAYVQKVLEARGLGKGEAIDLFHRAQVHLDPHHGIAIVTWEE